MGFGSFLKSAVTAPIKATKAIGGAGKAIGGASMQATKAVTKAPVSAAKSMTRKISGRR